MKTYLVTGGAGFIGSNFVLYMLCLLYTSDVYKRQPIACSLQEVPHYWFEFCILNQGDVAKHAEVPASGADEAGQRGVAGLNTLKEMYEKGYFPANTLTAGDADTFQMMADNKACLLYTSRCV